MQLSSYPAIIAQVLPRLQALKLPRRYQSTLLHRFLWRRGGAPLYHRQFLPVS